MEYSCHPVPLVSEAKGLDITSQNIPEKSRKGLYGVVIPKDKFFQMKHKNMNQSLDFKIIKTKKRQDNL